MKTDVKKHLLCALIILAVGITAYANSFGNEFVYDDNAVIVKNPNIRSLKNIGRLFFQDYFPEGSGNFNYYRPITAIVNTIDYSIWKLNPFGYHLTNFILHFTSAFLVYLVLFYFFGSFPVPLFLSLIFVCHPSATEAITYMPSRAEPLAFIFIAVSFLLFDLWQKDRRGKIFYFCSIAVFALACLSKETSVVFPAFLFLYASRKAKTAPYFFISGLYLLIRYFVLHAEENTFFAAANIAMSTRLISAPVVVVRYLKAFFVPSTYILEQPTVLYNHILNPAAALSWAALLAAAALVIKFRRQRWVMGALWFSIFIFPVSGVLPINNFFYHHWLYIPSLGILMILADLPGRFRRPLLAYAAAMVIICCGLTIKQNRHFKDELTLYREILSNFPGADRVHYNLGVVYLGMGRTDEAEAEFKEMIRLKPGSPDSAESYINLGYICQQKKLFGEAEEAFKKAAGVAPNKYISYYYLANLYNDTQRPAESIAYYKKAISLKGNNADVYFDFGRALDKTGEATAAIEAYEKAIQLDPSLIDAYMNMGSIFAERGQFRKAKEIWEKGLLIKPGDPSLKENLEKLNKFIS